MKKIIFLMLLSPACFAESFLIAGKIYEFTPTNEVLLGQCQGECDALKKIKQHKKIDIEKARKGLKFFGSVGSDVCTRVYMGKSLLGRNKDNDGRAFCYFEDKSLIELNSLGRYLSKNKIIAD